MKLPADELAARRATASRFPLTRRRDALAPELFRRAHVDHARRDQARVADMRGVAAASLGSRFGEARFDLPVPGAVRAALDLEFDVGDAEFGRPGGERRAARLFGQKIDRVGGKRLGDQLGAAFRRRSSTSRATIQLPRASASAIADQIGSCRVVADRVARRRRCAQRLAFQRVEQSPLPLDENLMVLAESRSARRRSPCPALRRSRRSCSRCPAAVASSRPLRRRPATEAPAFRRKSSSSSSRRFVATPRERQRAERVVIGTAQARNRHPQREIPRP